MTLALGAEALAAIAGGSQTTGLRRLQQALDEARLGPQGDLRDMLFATVRGYQLAKQSDVALLYLKELTELNARVRIEQMKLHQRRHLQRVNRGWSDRLSMAELVQQREIEARCRPPK